jgi:hypothetical protein
MRVSSAYYSPLERRFQRDAVKLGTTPAYSAFFLKFSDAEFMQ